jgi:acetyltransferase-like isoleucine patch superfamily enzyme
MDVNDITGAWDYSSLPANVRIGENCYLERRDAFIRFRSEQDPGLVLGDRVEVHTWTRFSVDPAGCLIVGEDSILVGGIFMCAESIRLGARCVVQYNVTIADSDFHPIDVELRRQDAIASSPAGDRSKRPALVTRPVVIGDDVWIGTGAIILKGVHVGNGATIAPGTVLTRDVPPKALAAGNPAVITAP